MISAADPVDAADPTEATARPSFDVLGRPDVTDYALALFDLGCGRWNEACDRLAALRDSTLSVVALPDRIEAAVRAGRHDEARAALEAFEYWIGESETDWSLARLVSCRALLADCQDATLLFEEALRLDVGGRPFETARIRLLYGEHLRRLRRRAEARVHLRAALAMFEELRADPWVERARNELRASGETARKRVPSTLGDLTPQETQVAGFVVQGLSNKEVATRLFVSPRTIDAHLRNVFSKLEVTSRTQLTRLLLAGDAVDTALPLAA
jgi:DNA-binding CsgD family transcriptional regulator